MTKQFEQMSEEEKEAMAGKAMLLFIELPAKVDGLIASLMLAAQAMQAQAHAMNTLAASNEELANALLQDMRDEQQDKEPQASTLDEES